jgi:hypothetical protein
MAKFQLDEPAYQEMLNLLNNQHFTEVLGSIVDFNLLFDDYWLQDSAVIENLVYRQGQWDVHLVFAHYKNPYRLIQRRITTCVGRAKAEIHAHYMKRQAAKDQRGTLTVDDRLFRFNGN